MKSRTFSVGLPAAFAILWVMVVPADAQIQAVRSLHVYDAHGTKVGKVLDGGPGGGSEARVAFKASGIPFLLVINNGDVYPFPFTGAAGALVFLEQGCSGAAYMTPASGPLGSAVVLGSTASVYLADPKAVPTMLVPKSLMFPDYPNPRCVAMGNPLPLVPAVSAGDLIPGFTPPFTAR